MAGLVAACEDRRRRGRGSAPGGELMALRREVVQLRRGWPRQQALVRAARRAVGLAPAPAAAPPPEPAPKRRGRKPTARALRMAALLQQGECGPTEAPPAGAVAEAAARPEGAPRSLDRREPEPEVKPRLQYAGEGGGRPPRRSSLGGSGDDKGTKTARDGTGGPAGRVGRGEGPADGVPGGPGGPMDGGGSRRRWASPNGGSTGCASGCCRPPWRAWNPGPGPAPAGRPIRPDGRRTWRRRCATCGWTCAADPGGNRPGHAPPDAAGRGAEKAGPEKGPAPAGGREGRQRATTAASGSGTPGATGAAGAGRPA